MMVTISTDLVILNTTPNVMATIKDNGHNVNIYINLMATIPKDVHTGHHSQ